ncbi:BlaI/MecI/CopY family transcriptional regulator [Streptomyces sp. YIM S03343]
MKQEETLLIDILAVTSRFDAPNDTAPSVPEQTPAEAPAAAATPETVPQQTRDEPSPEPGPVEPESAGSKPAEPEPTDPEHAEPEHAPEAAPAPGPPTAKRPRTAPGKMPAKTPRQRTTTRIPRTPRTAKPNPEPNPEPEPRQLLPRLGDLFTELLRAHGEPRLAKELRDELLVKHPDRAPTPQVVRNTLEALVAKGRVQRHKQQRSVLYTVTAPDEREAPQASG